MILDQQALFSDAQSISLSSNSTNVIDNAGNSNSPSGFVADPVSIIARVVTAFAGGTSLQVAIVSADDAGLTTNVTTHFLSATVPVANLVAGAMVVGTRIPPQKIRKYLGLQYSVVGVMTAGAITAGVVDSIDSLMQTTGFAKNYSV